MQKFHIHFLHLNLPFVCKNSTGKTIQITFWYFSSAPILSVQQFLRFVTVFPLFNRNLTSTKTQLASVNNPPLTLTCFLSNHQVGIFPTRHLAAPLFSLPSCPSSQSVIIVGTLLLEQVSLSVSERAVWHSPWSICSQSATKNKTKKKIEQKRR